MKQKTDIELTRARLIKEARAAIRLKHSAAADEEINRVVPKLLSKFDRLVLRGELPEVAFEESLS